ncbi:MAG: helix-turn-helix transcriptional regulator [Clostridia bacterium]|nr:helix-turn-helix transcriptional regulator [Clostridia bacterium]
MKFKERIAIAIKQSRYSQKQLAEMLGISESNITNWKNGENLPSVETLYKLCEILDESADYLLGLKD